MTQTKQLFYRVSSGCWWLVTSELIAQPLVIVSPSFGSVLLLCFGNTVCSSTGRQRPLGSTRLPGLGPGVAGEDLWAQSVRQETVSKGKLRQAELVQGQADKRWFRRQLWQDRRPAVHAAKHRSDFQLQRTHNSVY